MAKFFHLDVQVNKMVMFEVSYYCLRGNVNPYFSTEAMEWIRNKRDYRRCGQCQDDVLPAGPARDFWKKWDKYHLRVMTDEVNAELMEDVKALRERYNCLYREFQEGEPMPEFSFYDLKDLSKLSPIGKKF